MFALVFCLLLVFAEAQYMELCQMPGNSICKSVDFPGYNFRPCCTDSNVECLPWTGAGYVPSADGPDYFCQFVEPISIGGDCSAMKGSCDESSSCVDGVCVEGTNFLSLKTGVDICNQPPFPCDIASGKTDTKEQCGQFCSDQGVDNGAAWVWSDPKVAGVQDPNLCTCKNSNIVDHEFVPSPWAVFGPTYPIIGLDISNQPPFPSDIPMGNTTTYQICATECEAPGVGAVAWVWSDPFVTGVQEPNKCTCKNSNVYPKMWVQTPWAVAGFT